MQSVDYRYPGKALLRWSVLIFSTIIILFVISIIYERQRNMRRINKAVPIRIIINHDESTFIAPRKIVLQAIIDDAYRDNVSGVIFCIDDVQIGKDTTFPFTAIIENAPAEDCIVYVSTYDKNGYWNGRPKKFRISIQ